MVRFIDLSLEYWAHPLINTGPMCAFLSTSTDKFFENIDREHTFSSIEEIEELPLSVSNRLKGVVPPDFFERKVLLKETYDQLVKDAKKL
jgi:hypothetical protein